MLSDWQLWVVTGFGLVFVVRTCASIYRLTYYTRLGRKMFDFAREIRDDGVASLNEIRFITGFVLGAALFALVAICLH